LSRLGRPNIQLLIQVRHWLDVELSRQTSRRNNGKPPVEAGSGPELVDAAPTTCKTSAVLGAARSCFRDGTGDVHACGCQQNAGRRPGHLRIAADQRRGDGALDEKHELGCEAVGIR
jgi:hypothetical protein